MLGDETHISYYINFVHYNSRLFTKRPFHVLNFQSKGLRLTNPQQSRVQYCYSHTNSYTHQFLKTLLANLAFDGSPHYLPVMPIGTTGTHLAMGSAKHMSANGTSLRGSTDEALAYPSTFISLEEFDYSNSPDERCSPCIVRI